MCGCFSSEPDKPSDAGDAAQECDADTQNCPLLGKLRVSLIDDEDGKGIDAVDIAISGPDGSTRPTGSEGRVLFKGLHPGSYTAKHGGPCVSAASGTAAVSAGATADITLRVRHTHAVIVVKALSYSGNNVVEKDTTGNFPAPEWQDGRAASDQAPVAYVRNRKVAFDARFKVTTAPCRTETVAVRAKAAFGPARLEYYKFGAGTPSSGVFTCADLLSRGDGTGRCGAWARFLVAMHQAHGVASSKVFGVVPISASLLVVRNCDFVGPGTLPQPLTHEGNVDCVKRAGVPGQGKNNPQFLFGDHALVQHATGIYDPSYGVGPKANLRSWEDGGIAGIGEMPMVSLTFDGDPHIIPKTNSPGFVKHTLAGGETLAVLATRFGVASAKALYDHPCNAPLRALRAKPGDVKAGDAVVIPRAIASKLAILRIA